MKSGQTYKDVYTLEERKQKVEEQRQKYPDMIPIIVEKEKKCKLEEMDRRK